MRAAAPPRAEYGVRLSRPAGAARARPGQRRRRRWGEGGPVGRRRSRAEQVESLSESCTRPISESRPSSFRFPSESRPSSFRVFPRFGSCPRPLSECSVGRGGRAGLSRAQLVRVTTRYQAAATACAAGVRVGGTARGACGARRRLLARRAAWSRLVGRGGRGRAWRTELAGPADMTRRAYAGRLAPRSRLSDHGHLQPVTGRTLDVCVG